MKQTIFVFCLLISLSSCSKTKKKENNRIKTETSLKTTLNLDENSVLKEWVDFYQKIDSNFSVYQFDFTKTEKLNLIKGSVYGIFDKEFDTIYTDFLVFNDKKDKYIDFDSYNWVIDEKKTVLFSPDQEVNLVDVENKTVSRISFRGPSQWVEDAFWKNDSTIILLENTDENQSLITEINLKNNTVNTYQYKCKLKLQSEYSKIRFEKRGLTME